MKIHEYNLNDKTLAGNKVCREKFHQSPDGEQSAMFDIFEMLRDNHWFFSEPHSLTKEKVFHGATSNLSHLLINSGFSKF